ncbi:hypothetical protein BKI52_02620 [marine bacterium AO1-C]|nr:hypothetical protein BKI52_02620 [marine bacterium AO1-C]
MKMKNNLFNRGKPLALLLSLLLVLGLSSCGDFTRGIYSYKLHQAADTMKAKYPYFTVKLIPDSSGKYSLVTKKGLIKEGAIWAKKGDTLSVNLIPNYDFIRERLYELGIKNAEKVQKKIRELKKKKESGDSARRPRDGLR